MKTNIIIMSILFVVLFFLAWFSKGIDTAVEGLKQGGLMIKKIWLLLFIALGVAGLIQVLVPKDTISQLFGTAAGYKGILIAWLIGSIIPGAPYVILPIAASLLARGAGIAPTATLVLAASLVGISRIPYEIAFVGWKFSVVRVIGGFILPPVAGFIIFWANKLLKIYPL
ncbi:MAG: permease [Candidatus Aminicenantes bacterium]